MEFDGTGVTNLTNAGGHDNHPRWSPDGNRIAYDRSDGVYMMDVDGSNQTQLISNAGGNPKWSPDGKKITYQSDVDGNFEIYVMDADGANPTRLTTDSAQDSHPCWSPDGSQIVFDSQRDGNSEIYVMDANGGNQENLTNNSSTDNIPCWSPDGSQIVFQSSRDGSTSQYVMDADGLNQKKLTAAQDDQYGSWSPEDGKIFFMTRRNGDADIYRMNANGSDETQWTSTSDADTWPQMMPFRHVGTVEVGSSVSRVLTVRNGGDGDLTVSEIALSDGQFTVDQTSFTLVPGNSQLVSVMYTPTVDGTSYSTLTISSDDPDLPSAVMTINGTTPAISLMASLEVAGSIVFVSERDENEEIYRMDEDGFESDSVDDGWWEGCWSAVVS